MNNKLNNTIQPDEMVEVYDEIPLWSAPFGIKLLENINYKPNIKALDIGFGTGFPLIELAMRLGNTCIVYGIDPWKEAIKRAKRKIEIYGISNIKIIEGIAESIPLDNNSIDLITSNNGINNVSNINEVLTECSRVLKKDGQFVITMNTFQTMYEFYEVFENVLAGLNMKNEIGLLLKHRTQKRQPIEYITSLMKQHGLIINELEHSQFNYKFTDGSAFLEHYFIRLAFIDSWKNILPKEKTKEIFDTIKLRLNEKAKLFGGLQLSIPFVCINACKI